MNSQKLNDWLQIVGLFGVIASLVFVGLQLQQTHAIALSQTYQNRTATSISMNAGVLGSPEALSGVSKIYRNASAELTMPEAVALEYMIGSTMITIENNHAQFVSGFLAEEHWQNNLTDVRCMLTVPLFREVIQAWPFRESFDRVIEGLLREIPPDAGNCWVNSYKWDYPMP